MNSEEKRLKFYPWKGKSHRIHSLLVEMKETARPGFSSWQIKHFLPVGIN